MMKDRDPRDMQEQIVYTDAGAQTVPIALSIWAAILAAHNRETCKNSSFTLMRGRRRCPSPSQSGRPFWPRTTARTPRRNGSSPPP